MNRTKTPRVDFQTLEGRQLLAAVTVGGSNAAENFRVYVQSNTLIVEVDGFGNSYPDFLYDGVVINALGGADTIIVDSNTDNSVTVNGGSGVDTIEIGATDHLLDGIESPITIGNSSGADKVYLHAEADATNGTYAVTSTAVTRTGYPTITYGDSALIRIYEGDGVDRFNVTSTLTSNRYELLGGGGDDTFDVRSTNGATVVVDGQAGFDLVSLNSDLGTPASVQFDVSQDLSRIDSEAGGSIRVNGTAGIYLETNQSNYEGDLDLDKGFMIENHSINADGQGYWRQRLVDAQTNTSPQLRSAFADSSSAIDSLGYRYGGYLISSLEGFPLDPDDLLIRYTLVGDATLDQRVNFDDLLTVAMNYDPVVTGKFWSQGDFNLDGAVNFSDLLPLAQNYGTSVLQSSVLSPSRSTSRNTLRELA